MTYYTNHPIDTIYKQCAVISMTEKHAVILCEGVVKEVSKDYLWTKPNKKFKKVK